MAVRDAVEEAVQHLGGDNSQVNRLAAGAGVGVEQLTFEFELAGLQPGAEIELGGSERVYVLSVYEGTKTVDALRGYAGTSEVAHLSGTVARVAPTIFRSEVFAEVKNAVRRLSSLGLFRVAEAGVSFDWPSWRFDASAVQDVDSFYALLVSDGVQEFERFDFSVHDVSSIRPHFAPPTSDAVVTYRARLTAPSSLSDDLVADVGLSDTAVDLPGLGAAARMWPKVAGQRSQVRSHSGHRRPDAVTPMDPMRQGQLLNEMFLTRVNEETMRLRRKMPLRTS